MVLEGLQPQLPTKLAFAPPIGLPDIHPAGTLGFGALNCHTPTQHALIILLLACFGLVGVLLHEGAPFATPNLQRCSPNPSIAF